MRVALDVTPETVGLGKGWPFLFLLCMPVVLIFVAMPTYDHFMMDLRLTCIFGHGWKTKSQTVRTGMGWSVLHSA